MTYEKELKYASEIAEEAGRILLRIYATDFSVSLKGRVDPVTEADTLANAFLVAALRQTFPEDGVVAEESADNSDALTKSRCWYVDPLDGTKEFIAKNGEFSVMLGLAVQGEAKVGVVYQPVLNKLYSGIVGVGATLKQSGNTQPLQVSTTAETRQLKFVSSRSHRSSSVDNICNSLGIAESMVSGSVGLKVGLIAEQKADLYAHVSDKSCAWDACGPEAILRAAGGRFTDLGGEPFRYGGSDLSNRRGILACNAAAFSEVLPVVSQEAKRKGLLA